MKSFKELHKKYSINKLIKKVDDRYGFQFIVRQLSSHWFNPFATLYVNILSFPLSQAIKLPIYIYGRPGLYHVVGDMVIKGKVKSGMIKFNKTNALRSSLQKSNSELSNLGTIIFHGNASIGCGTKILVQKGATLELGESVVLTDFINLGCHNHISIGDYTRIAHRSQIQESNHHFIYDVKTRTVTSCTHPISIGKGCWICNSATITSGVTIPDHCIVASNSLVNKKEEITNAQLGSIIGGIPAKVLTSGRYRIFNSKCESFLYQWFASHPNDSYNFSNETQLDELINP